MSVYLPFLLRQLGDALPAQYDHRYFYRTGTRLCSYVCGFAKDALIAALNRIGCTSVFVGSTWLAAIIQEKNATVPNNSLIGELVEPTIVTAIAKSGITLPGLGNVRPELQYFSAKTEEGFLVEKNKAVLYVPDVFNYTNIDAVLRVHKGNMLYVFGIQITVGTYNAHQHSATNWTATPCCSKWIGKSSDFRLAPPINHTGPTPDDVVRWNFLWVMPVANFPTTATTSHAQVGPRTKSQTKSGTPASPAYTELFYGFADFITELDLLDR